MRQTLSTPGRRREAIAGVFTANGSSAVTSPDGDGVPVRAGVGSFTVTLPRKYSALIGLGAGANTGTGDQKVGDVTYSNSSGVTVITISVIDISGAAAADITGNINWWATGDDAI